MPSEKFPRAPMWCALSLALGLGLTAIDADAAGLGRLSVQSGLGQPLAGRARSHLGRARRSANAAGEARSAVGVSRGESRIQSGTYEYPVRSGPTPGRQLSGSHLLGTGRQRTVSGHDGRAHLGHRPGDPRIHRPARSAGVEESRRTSSRRRHRLHRWLPRRCRCHARAAPAPTPAPAPATAGAAPLPAPLPTPAPTAERAAPSTASGGGYTRQVGRHARQDRQSKTAVPRRWTRCWSHCSAPIPTPSSIRT